MYLKKYQVGCGHKLWRNLAYWQEYTDGVSTSPQTAIKVRWRCNFSSGLKNSKYWLVAQNLKQLLARLDKQKMYCGVWFSVIIHVRQGCDLFNSLWVKDIWVGGKPSKTPKWTVCSNLLSTQSECWKMWSTDTALFPFFSPFTVVPLYSALITFCLAAQHLKLDPHIALGMFLQVRNITTSEHWGGYGPYISTAIYIQYIHVLSSQ